MPCHQTWHVALFLSTGMGTWLFRLALAVLVAGQGACSHMLPIRLEAWLLLPALYLGVSACAGCHDCAGLGTWLCLSVPGWAPGLLYITGLGPWFVALRCDCSHCCSSVCLSLPGWIPGRSGVLRADGAQAWL